MMMLILSGNGAKAELSSVNGISELNISGLGDRNFSVQMFSEAFFLEKDSYYKFSLDISCTKKRYIDTAVQQDGGAYRLLEVRGAEISPEISRIELVFQKRNGIDHVKVILNCGNHGELLDSHKIFVHRLSFEEITDYKENKEAVNEPMILVNQVGYLPESVKIAVIRGDSSEKSFTVVNSDSGDTVFSGILSDEIYSEGSQEKICYADFSEVTENGRYYITCGEYDKSYEFEIGSNVYRNVLDDSIRMLYLQRCGVSVEDSVFGHEACHTSKALVYGTDEKIDVSGGWHDAGDYGRYIVPAAKTIADLLIAYRMVPELFSDDTSIPESRNGIPDVLDEVRFELEWFMKMQSSSGGVYHKVSCAQFCSAISPERENNPLITAPVSITATADFCGVMAMAWEIYKNFDLSFAEKCMAAAKAAWNFIEDNPCLEYKNPADIHTGGYTDHDSRDEIYWASCQMYRATGDAVYLDAIGIIEGDNFTSGLGWCKMGHYGNIALSDMEANSTQINFISAARDYIIRSAEIMAEYAEKSGYNTAVNRFGWGSNMDVANAGIILFIAYKLTGNERYRSIAQYQLDYLLGRNPCGICFVTGHGSRSPENPHHRPSMAKKSAMKGMLVGGVNSDLADETARKIIGEAPAEKRYVDHFGSYSTNEVAIYWNSAFTLLTALILGEE